MVTDAPAAVPSSFYRAADSSSNKRGKKDISSN